MCIFNVTYFGSPSVFAFVIMGWGGNSLHQDIPFFFFFLMFLKDEIQNNLGQWEKQFWD